MFESEVGGSTPRYVRRQTRVERCEFAAPACWCRSAPIQKDAITGRVCTGVLQLKGSFRRRVLQLRPAQLGPCVPAGCEFVMSPLAESSSEDEDDDGDDAALHEASGCRGAL